MLLSSRVSSSATVGFLRRTHSARCGLVLAVLVLAAAGGVSFASEDSLDGDALRPLSAIRRGHVGPASFPAYVVEIVSSRNDGAGRKKGLGVIYRPDGVIMTVLDAIEPNCDLEVRIPGRGKREASLLGVDRRFGIVMLKVDGWNLPAVEFGDSTQIKPGQNVFAVNPWGPRNAGKRPPNGCRPEYQAAVAHKRAPMPASSPSICASMLTLDFDSAPTEKQGGAVVDGRGRLIALVSGSGGCGTTQRLQRRALPANIARRVADHLLLSREFSRF